MYQAIKILKKQKRWAALLLLFSYVNQIRYDGECGLVEATDALGNRTETELDAVGNVIMITDACGKSLSYEYDSAYRVYTVYDAKNICVAIFPNSFNVIVNELDEHEDIRKLGK